MALASVLTYYVYEQKGDFPYMSIERKRLMKRVLIIVPNCSGKTTFSRQLRDKLAMPLVHLDSLYWLDNWEVRPCDEFNRPLDIELNKDSWIVLLFNRNNREDFRKLLEKAENRGVKVIVFRSYREIGEYLEKN